MTDKMPPLPSQVVVDTHLPTGVRLYGHTPDQMHAYARTHAAAVAALLVEAHRVELAMWMDLYRRAVNEANGLTNYVEDRPELRKAEQRLSLIEQQARAALAAYKEQQ